MAILPNDLFSDLNIIISMKQVDKIIKKGDYYEMEVVDDGIFSIKSYKKEESQVNPPLSSDNITTDLPAFSDARSQFYFQHLNHYTSA